ncbi:MAG: DEAD/DEAH box helicase [Clostridia bacterium]
MDNFSRLAPFIRDYIYKEHWEDLREVQVAACNVLFDTSDNLLLSSGTASGKTEAAFLPILTKLYENPSKSVGILYISPLKALINDQFNRLYDLLSESHINVTKWHGDSSRTEKNKLLKNPNGIMQTTPESLEAMIMNRKSEAITLFSDLKYIIVDEVHYFMCEDRGAQLLCILERIQRLTNIIPIRIGLSATLGDIESAKNWLTTGTNRKCSAPIINSEKRKLRLSLEHFYVKYDAKTAKEKELMKAYYQYLYAITFNKKSIVFSNSKAEVEENIAHIKKISEKNKTGGDYLVHHGNISSGFREYAEKKMKSSDAPVVTGATVTLELGIDLGQLSRIVQTGCPLSVSSFVQRLGRTGRRGDPSEMWFVFREDNSKNNEEFFKAINWNFLRCIAIIELYLTEKWIEPIKKDKLPFGILYHQTMSFLVSAGEISPPALASYILSLDLFKNVSQKDFRTLLRHLITINQIEQTENNGILIGENGEREVNRYEFYTVFENPKEYSVKLGAEEIGTIQEAFPVGESFALAGRTWETISIDKSAMVIYVKELPGISKISFVNSASSNVHIKVVKKMLQCLISDTNYKYLSSSATIRLSEIRQMAKKSKITTEVIIKISEDTYGIFAFLGSHELITLSIILSSFGFANEPFFDRQTPVCLFITERSYSEIYEVLDYIKTHNLDKNALLIPDTFEIEGKYNEFIPRELLKKEFIEDFIDIDSLKNNL